MRLVAGIFAGVVVLVGLGAALLWWKASNLKADLLRDLGHALDAQVEVASVNLDLWKGELHAAGITLTNKRPSAPWEKGGISQASLRFHLRDLLASTLPVEIEVSSWNVTLTPPGLASAETPAPSSLPDTTPVAPSSSKIALEVTRLMAREGTVEIHLSGGRNVSIRGVAFQAANNGAQVWTTDLQAASILAGTFQAAAGSVHLEGRPGHVTFSQLRIACDPGFITGDGEAALDDAHSVRLDLQATSVPVTMLVSVDWQMKLAGLASGTLHFESDDRNATARGQISVSQGKFTLLPWLGKVTALVNLPDISNVELDQATSDFIWKNGALHFTNLDIRKNDVVRMGGTVDIDPQEQVDGHLELGLPSSVTAKWPDLQTKVFSTARENYNWTDVHLTGTPDHLQEDLTPRLLAAGMQEGGDLLDQAKKKAADLFNNFIGH